MSNNSIDFGEPSGSKAASEVVLKIGNKRLRIELYDSDDEFDDWFIESVIDKVGLRPRSLWMHPLNMEREMSGEYVTLCLPLREYPDKFFKYFRMKPSTYDYILETIKNDLIKYSNRPSISPGERLAVTLRYDIFNCMIFLIAQ